MSIWQLILVVLPVVRLGAGLHGMIEAHKKGDKKESSLGAFLGIVIVFFFVEFVLYKAGVLIVN
jgi:hypothetical protein